LKNLFIFAVSLLLAGSAFAESKGVGLGVAGGASFSPDKVQGTSVRGGTSEAWGFFVDIPLLPTFYIAPSATLYRVNLGKGMNPVTDLDMAFKFIVPFAIFKAGGGVLVGTTTTAESYKGHYGALGFFSAAFFPNLEAFGMVQYKRWMSEPVDNVQVLAGGMFRF
jgi:hypothetical protein